LVLKYELESSLQYPGQLYEDRRREITQAQTLADSVNALLPKAAQVGARQFDLVLTRIQTFIASNPPTPYRDALKHVQRLAEAGKRGEAPPELPADDAGVPQIAHGKPAPEFLVKDLTTKESVRLRQWLGRPLLLVFYSPNSPTVDRVLRFAQDVQDRQGDQVHVITLAVSDEVDRLLQQRKDMKVTVPVLSGTGLRLTYGVEATPKVVVIDAAGVVRTSYIGWGPETPFTVLEDLRRCRPVAAGDGGSRIEDRGSKSVRP
jgi:peroxiredoxin